MVRQSGNGDRITRILSGIGITLSVAAIIAISAEWRRFVIFMSVMEKAMTGFEHLAHDVNLLDERMTRNDAERPLLVRRFEVALDSLVKEDERLEKLIVDGLKAKPPQYLKQEIAGIKKSDERLMLEDQRLQRQIDRLEAEVFFGRKKPPLPPYVED